MNRNWPSGNLKSSVKNFIGCDNWGLRCDCHFFFMNTLQKFYCGGRIVFGPDIKSIFLTLSLILIPVILFWVFVAKALIIAYHGEGIILVVSSALLTAYVSFYIQ